MTPRYRAWIKTEKRMFFSDDILAIDYENEEIVTQQVYFENGLLDDRDIYFYDFDEIELMQSTGLVDKNGKEIFEGDVVSIDTDEFDLLFVKYESGIYWLMDDEECVEHLSDYYKYVSIEGNIYENPELLEDK